MIVAFNRWNGIYAEFQLNTPVQRLKDGPAGTVSESYTESFTEAAIKGLIENSLYAQQEKDILQQALNSLPRAGDTI